MQSVIMKLNNDPPNEIHRGRSNNITIYYRRQNQDSDSITSEDLAIWLKDQKILNTLLTDYLHLPQYVEKLDKILKLVRLFVC